MAYLLTRSSTQTQAFCAHIQLPAEAATIGRSARARIRIRDSSVSKLHAVIEPVAGEAGRFRIRDTGSRNGVFLHGKRCDEGVIQIGDELRLGNITLVLCAGSEEPPTIAIELASSRGLPAAKSAIGSRVRAMARALLDGPEHRLFAVFVGLIVVLALLIWLLPSENRDDPVPGGDRPTAAVTPGETTTTIASHKDATNVEPSPDTTAQAGREPPPRDTALEPDASRSAVPAVPRSDVSGDAAPWVVLGAELDQTCGNAGCHLAAADVAFVVTPDAELGRWERNLLRLRTRGSIEPDASPDGKADGAGWHVASFSTTPPHDRPLPVALSASAARGVAHLRATSGRLLERERPGASFAALAPENADAMRAVRRAWILLYGRVPVPGEMQAALRISAEDLLAEARGRTEFWQARARNALRMRERCGIHGGFPLAESLRTCEPPADAARVAEWTSQVRAELERAGAIVDLPSIYRSNAPLPEDGGDDAAYRGWFLAALADSPRALPPDAVALSFWCALWGRPPDATERELLLRTVGGGIPWSVLGDRLLAFLLHAPSTPIAVPSPEDSRAWVRGLLKYTVGVEPDDELVGDIAERVVSGAVGIDLLFEELLGGEEWLHD